MGRPRAAAGWFDGPAPRLGRQRFPAFDPRPRLSDRASRRAAAAPARISRWRFAHCAATPAARGRSPATSQRQAKPPVPPRRISSLQTWWDRHSAQYHSNFSGPSVGRGFRPAAGLRASVARRRLRAPLRIWARFAASGAERKLGGKAEAMPHNLVCQNLSGIGHSACLDFCHGLPVHTGSTSLRVAGPVRGRSLTTLDRFGGFLRQPMVSRLTMRLVKLQHATLPVAFSTTVWSNRCPVLPPVASISET